MLTDTLSTRARWRIGEWIADPATNELTRGAESVRIEPKAMDVLVLMAGRAGSVVTRDELFSSVWPGTVVGDEALSQSITKLRKALGDDPRAPIYIETVPKRGYRLLAPAHPAEAAPAAAAPVRALARPRSALAWTAAVVVLVGLAATYYLYPTARFPAASPAVVPGDDREDWVAVAVLPFESLGGTADQAYLAHGISDGLMASLGKLSGLRVIRSSRGATAANARYIASGSVQREGDALRIHVFLVDARRNEQIWSERFERPFGELFALQDDIIRRMTAALPAQVSDAERKRLAQRYTRSVEAYDHFLRAQERFLVRGPLDNQQARDLYRRAIELDPKFARAYAGLAMTYALEHRLQPAGGARPGLERAFELAESARLIDPDIAQVHWAIAFVQAQSRRHDEALASLERAIALDQSFADAYALAAGVHTYRGEPAKSIPLLRTAMRFNPEGGYLYFLVLGRAYFFEGDNEQALINLREALLRNPADLEAHLYLVAALVAAGDASEAAWEAEEIRSLEQGFSTRAWLDGYPLASAPHRERLRELLAKAGL